MANKIKVSNIFVDAERIGISLTALWVDVINHLIKTQNPEESEADD